MVAHPQPHEMPPAVGLRIIDKSRTAMAEGPVVDELYLSGLQAEIDREVIVLEKVEHRRDCYLAILVKRLTLERVPAADLVDAEARQCFAALENRRGEDGLLTRVVLALTVEPERLVEPL